MKRQDWLNTIICFSIGHMNTHFEYQAINFEHSRDLGNQFEGRFLNIDTSVIVMANSDQTLEEPNLQTWLKSSQSNAVCTKTHKAAH